MTIYTPDNWVLLEFKDESFGTYHKILGGWGGSYIGADHWRLNSGISNIEFNDSLFVVKGYSGSEYRCSELAQGFSGITSQVFATIQKQAKETNGKTTVSVIELTKENFKDIGVNT